MAEKKEILDYLRNCQKAVEIEAKVNGINLWVLCGAIGVLGWTFFGYLHLDFSAYCEELVHTLLFGQSIYFLNWVGTPNHGVRDELRYQPWRLNDVDSPFLVFVEGAWLALPPALHFLILGGSWSVVFMGIFPLAIMVMAALDVLKVLVVIGGEVSKFPKPRFALSKRTYAANNIWVGLGFVLVAFFQFMALIGGKSQPSDAVKAIALLVSIYLLLAISIRKARAGHAIQWTYELETDVLVGAISPEDALRKIEYRSLGSRFQDVMNSFFSEFDKKLEKFEEKFNHCHNIPSEIQKIPSEFKAERSSRFEAATVEIKGLLDDMSKDLQELSEYLKTLEAKKSDLRVAAAIKDLGEKRDLYRGKFKSADNRLSGLRNVALNK
ncbi:MAG: hypothetical protein LWW96_19535 [Acidovorax sp.]|uniref:hypothetical protein n=1 Tax=Acidovorax sp. TaxID=1872122 RepID=UPI0025BE2CE9|nr:hypothetical protein [Acidovorax sp.]MCE1194342.1 hypothetical protein [Acidovorax sp.]